MAHSDHHPKAPEKKVSLSDSVDSLIQKKKAEKQTEVSESVSMKQAGVYEGVAEVMGGIEKPNEKVSERKGETGEKGDITTSGSASSDDDQFQILARDLKDYDFPSEEIMVKKVRTAISAQIKLEWKRATKYQGNLSSGGADGYNHAIARIRSLKELMNSLFTATFGFLKNMYVKYFTPDGKRRNFDEI